MSDIKDIVAALEAALEAQAIKDSDGSAPFMTRKQLRRLLDALKGAEARGGQLAEIGLALNTATEDKLSRAVELLKDAEDFCPKPYSTAIAAFLKEAGHE